MRCAASCNHPAQTLPPDPCRGRRPPQVCCRPPESSDSAFSAPTSWRYNPSGRPRHKAQPHGWASTGSLVERVVRPRRKPALTRAAAQTKKSSWVKTYLLLPSIGSSSGWIISPLGLSGQVRNLLQICFDRLTVFSRSSIITEEHSMAPVSYTHLR